MLERVVEDWLDKSNERNWQQAFCTMLLANGHTILHSTRHNAMELGVDVLSVDADRTLCAFQLKGTDNGTLRLRDWREISSQVDEMVCRFIEVPGNVSNGQQHRSFLGHFRNKDARRAKWWEEPFHSKRVLPSSSLSSFQPTYWSVTSFSP